MGWRGRPAGREVEERVARRAADLREGVPSLVGVASGPTKEGNGHTGNGNGHGGETAIGPDYEPRGKTEWNGYGSGQGNGSPQSEGNGNGHGHYPGATLG